MIYFRLTDVGSG